IENEINLNWQSIGNGKYRFADSNPNLTNKSLLNGKSLVMDLKHMKVEDFLNTFKSAKPNGILIESRNRSNLRNDKDIFSEASHLNCILDLEKDVSIKYSLKVIG
ncbi:MAG: hypothetical protein MHPSP_002184, partial [Paramarteilia canceri]